MLMTYFEADPYPGRAKILFIGLGMSTHTHSWIDLLAEARLNIRLFAVPGGGVPPADWQIRTYLCESSAQLPLGLDPSNRLSFYPLPEEIRLSQAESEKRKTALEKSLSFRLYGFLRDITNLLAKRLGVSRQNDSHAYSLPPPLVHSSRAASPEEWLAQIIRDWQPDVIHTLGLFDGQGGAFYAEVRNRFGLKGIGKWILQLRGGSDLALRQYHPETATQIREIFNDCDQIITDNYVNIDYIKRLGLGYKVASIAPVPGTGGVDTTLELDDIILPSRKERIILWPKAYESIWSKALPVMEAIKLAWQDIKPCKIYMTASNPETDAWFLAMLPQEIRENCTLIQRIPRNELLNLMKRARVLLIPSLVDGVPNSLYEAMANSVFPIVSPLDTITPVVKNESNVLFARNLYPDEIREALTRAMADDELVDEAAKHNLDLVKQVASREKIAKELISYYESFSSPRAALSTDSPLVTVITPTYNRANLLPETIESVLSQDYPHIEYIVLDDGSKDHTKEVMQQYRDRVIFVSHPNMGETRTVNKGFEMAEGEFICVVNSDDPILPGAITSLVRAIQAQPDALVAYPDWVEIDSDSRPIKEMRLPDYDIYNMLKIFNVALGPGNLFRRSALEKYGYRDLQRKYTGDLEFWFRLAAHGKLVHVPKILATHRTHPDSASVSEKSSRMATELISIVESLFRERDLPRDLAAEKNRIIAQAYYVASFYCTGEPLKGRKYRLLAYFYDPKRLVIYFFNIALSGIRFFLQCVKLVLKLILPQATYLRILSWWMQLNGRNHQTQGPV